MSLRKCLFRSFAHFPFLKCAVFSLNCQNLGEILGEVLYQIFSILKVVFTILMMFLEVYKLAIWLDLVVCTSTPNTQKTEAPKPQPSETLPQKQLLLFQFVMTEFTYVFCAFDVDAKKP